MFQILAAALLSVALTIVPQAHKKASSQRQIESPIEKLSVADTLSEVSPAPEFTSPTLVLKKIAAVAPSDLQGLFEKYAKEYGADESLLKNIAKCESSFGSGANSGPYGGMFQYTVDTWKSTRSAMGLDTNPDLRFSAEESIKTSAFKLSHGGASAWPVCSKS